MSKFRAIAGYVLGGVMFVVLLPTIMWLASGMPALEHIGVCRASITGVLIIGGLALSIWTIVYMKRRGKGNPMDAFDHEIGPRTQHLMVDGPYRLNRNPMLTGTFIYLLGYIVWLWTWQALLVWVIFVAIMIVQVLSEEKRLRRDFGEEYEAYCRRTGRFLPWTFGGRAVSYHSRGGGRFYAWQAHTLHLCGRPSFANHCLCASALRRTFGLRLWALAWRQNPFAYLGAQRIDH